MYKRQSDETAMMATIIQAELAELGINVELCGYDSQLFNQYKFCLLYTSTL